MPTPNVMPKCFHNRDLTRTELHAACGCAACGFDNFNPMTDRLNEVDLCPTCATQLGYVLIKVCARCGELYAVVDACPCCREQQWRAA